MKIRPSRSTDEEAIRELFRISFGKDLSHDFWIWKYYRSYLGSSSLVSEDKGRLVAHYGGFKLNFYSYPNVLIAYQGCDVMTHPLYRAKIFSRKSIIVRTAEAFFQSYPMEFIFGFPSERHGRLMSLQLGFESYVFVSLLTKDHKAFARGKNLFLLCTTGWENFDRNKIDRLWDVCKKQYPLTIDKNSNYLMWRYRDNPLRRYELLLLRGLLKRKLRALMIFTIQRRELYLMDFFITEDADIEEVFSALEVLARQRGVERIKLWLNPGEKVYQVFKKLGYHEERGIPYTVRVFEGSKISSEFFMKHYCYRMGDYDAL